MAFKMRGFGGYHGKKSSFRKQDMSLEARLKRNREKAIESGEEYAARQQALSDWRKSDVKLDHLNPSGPTGWNKIRLTNSLIDAMRRQTRSKSTSPEQLKFLRHVLQYAKPGKVISWSSDGSGGASISTKTGAEKGYWRHKDINQFLDQMANYAQRDSSDSEINLESIKRPRSQPEIPIDDSLPERELTGPRLNEIPAKPVNVDDITRIEMPEGYTGYTNEIPPSVIKTGDKKKYIGDNKFEVDMEDIVLTPRMQEERDAETERQKLIDELKNAKMHSDKRRDIYDQLNWKYDDTIAASNVSDRRKSSPPASYPGSTAEGVRDAGRKSIKTKKKKPKKDKDGNVISRAIDKISLGTGAGWDPLAKVTEFLGGK